jgi:hypothetical protein
VNQKQLGHYVSGNRRPSVKTVKIESSLHDLAEELRIFFADYFISEQNAPKQISGYFLRQ